VIQVDLRTARKQRGISLTKLCQLSGIHPSNLSRIELGQIRVYPGWRRRIAQALGIPEEELFPEVSRDARDH
jgi:transcriptional regulator with XRE-family HTH domain